VSEKEALRRGCVETAEHAAVASLALTGLLGSAFGLLATVQGFGNLAASAIAGDMASTFITSHSHDEPHIIFTDIGPLSIAIEGMTYDGHIAAVSLSRGGRRSVSL
jgi:hypothetical protein